jgi:glycosyltransferase involved in cell wall biosynthesis
VPHYDKDAGSRTTFQYLKMFSEMGFNVKFLGDNFFKHEPYATVLEQMGIEVLYGTWYRDNYEKWIKANADKIDYVYLNRPHISIKYMDLIRKYSSAKIIYYGHDLHFIRELKRFEIEKNEEFLKSSNNWKKIEFELFEKSDVIFTLSESEYKIIRDAFPSKKILIIPTFIYEDFHICDYSIPKEDLLFVGGFSHTPNVDAVNWFVNDIFPLIQAKLPEVKCYIVGSNPPKEILDLNSRQVIIKGFISDAELISLYQQIKIVVIPLRYGAGVKGKTIEAMYHSVPIVSTDFGIEGLKDIEQIITPCNTAEDFANEVINLYNDETRLNQLREKYRDYVKKYFSKQRAIAVLKEALED